jgi:hypothetical protein
MAKKQTTKKATPNAKEVKTEAKKKAKKQVDLVPGKIYSFKANAKAKHLLDGKVYQIAGEIAQGLIEKGWGEITE